MSTYFLYALIAVIEIGQRNERNAKQKGNDRKKKNR